MTSKYFMPPEWEKHVGTLLSWPENSDTWEGVEQEVKNSMALLIANISRFETVFVAVNNPYEHETIRRLVINNQGVWEKVEILDIPTNDSWTRDFGPNYVFKYSQAGKREIVINDWGYNAWGGKYPPWNDDSMFCSRFAVRKKDILIKPPMILEGGSIDVNGDGLMMTTRSCLLNPNRNPHLSMEEIEENLKLYLGVEQIIWIDKGVAGDDTDGHIDDFARFVDKDKIVCAYEENKGDENFEALHSAFNALKNHPEILKRKIQVFALPMPAPKFFRDIRLPASYANFYFVNGAILVPVFDDSMDYKALSLLKELRPDLEVIGVPGLNFVRGLGGIHCLTQQIY